ncbi:MAG: carotenoid biosynthesis protein [Bacteroidia bacterium]
MSPFAKKLPFKFTELHGALILIIFHVVGIVGLSSSIRPYMIELTSFNLLLSLFVLLAFHPKYSPRFFVFAITSFLIGFGAEWLGVHTGYLFGDYAYGSVLGIKLDDIPLIIGVNWVMLSIVCGEIVSSFIHPKALRAILAALLMTGLDYLIEPVAINLGYWHWQSSEIPLSNYASWFIVALPLQFLYQWSRSGNNPLAKWLFLSQVLFFIALQVL